MVLENATVINSEFKGRGELLPYIYYLRNPIFEKAVIIHDSVFFQRHVDFDLNQENIPLWHFDGATLIQNNDCELSLISSLKNAIPLTQYYNKKSFRGCFGCMSMITYDFLKNIDAKYNLENLLDKIIDRHCRMCAERVFGLIFSIEHNGTNEKLSVFGNISNYNQGYTYDRYLYDKEQCYMPNIPVIKVWTGR